MRSILMRMFGRPQGVLGRLGGVIMARMNADCGVWVSDLLKVGPKDSVLEVGFGPGVVIQRLSQLAGAGHVAGIDSSREMVEQARAREYSCRLTCRRIGGEQ
jgi:protein-L-isoaspartate O-methyltransferase